MSSYAAGFLLCLLIGSASCVGQEDGVHLAGRPLQSAAPPATPEKNCARFVGLISVATRLGDRLLDSFAVATVFALNNASALCTLHVFSHDQYGQAAPETDTLIVGGRCDVKMTDASSFAAVAQSAEPGTCTLELSELYGGGGGTFTPLAIHQSTAARRYIPAAVTYKGIVSEYKRIAHATYSMAHSRWTRAPESAFITGVHFRTTDKLVDAWDHHGEQDKYLTTKGRQEQLTERCFAYIEHELVKHRALRLFYLAVDEESCFAALNDRILKAGGVVLNNNRSTHTGVLNDLIGLSSTDLILQVTRYSTFSLAAAHMARVVLVNFGNSTTTNAIGIWEPSLMIDMPYLAY